MAFLGRIRRAAVELGGVMARTWPPLSPGHPWASLTKAPRAGLPSSPLTSLDLGIAIGMARPNAPKPPAPPRGSSSSSETARRLFSSRPSPSGGVIETAIAGTPASPSSYCLAGKARSLSSGQTHRHASLGPWRSRSFSETVNPGPPPPIASHFCFSRCYSTPGPDLVLPEEPDSVRKPTAPPHYRSIFNPSIIHKEAWLAKTTQNVIAERCVDEGSLHLNYDPMAYVKARTMMREVAIPGTEPHQFVWIDTEEWQVLKRSLLLVLRELHINGVCIAPSTPLSVDNVAITSASRFRLCADKICFEDLRCHPRGVKSDLWGASSKVLKCLQVMSTGVLDVLATSAHDIKG